jgi:subtilisin family serine protease
LAVDLARVETRTDDAIARFGVTGNGVLVAIMDRGIDWRNNDFCNSNGTTRIKYIFDLTDDTGANAVGNTYGKGTIYTEAQINAALSGGSGPAKCAKHLGFFPNRQ